MTSILTLDIEDTPGNLGKAARCLADNNVNIEGFNAFGGHVAFLTDNTDKAMSCLQKKGFTPKMQEVAPLSVPNQPGALAELAEGLGQAKVNIRSSFGTTRGDTGTIYLAVDNPKAAAPVLERYGPAQITSR